MNLIPCVNKAYDAACSSSRKLNKLALSKRKMFISITPSRRKAIWRFFIDRGFQNNPALQVNQEKKTVNQQGVSLYTGSTCTSCGEVSPLEPVSVVRLRKELVI